MQLDALTNGFRSGGSDGALVQRSVLPGGVRVLTEAMPSLRSATLAFWVPVGSRHEVDGHFGSTHFLEHLLFKGTPTRSAFDISLAFDEVGGISNAGTGKEFTYYFAQVRDANIPMAIDVLTDMVTSASLNDHDVEAERGVILDELAMDEDDPDDVVSERLTEAVYGADHPMGRPIGGTPQTVRGITGDAIRAHYRKFYYPENLVVVAAGRVEHEQICELLSAALAKSSWSDRAPQPAVQPACAVETMSLLKARPAQRVTVNRPNEQANVRIGGPGLVCGDPREPAYVLFSAILGGDSSSRITQEVREKRGLAYSLQAFGSMNTDSGMFGVAAGCAPENVQLVSDLMLEQWRQLAHDGPTEAERRRVIGGMAGYMALGLERTGSRMRRLAWAELFDREFHDAESEIQRLEAVTCAQIQQIAGELYEAQKHVSVVGPFDHDPVVVR